MISKYFWTKFAVCFWQAREFRYTVFLELRTDVVKKILKIKDSYFRNWLLDLVKGQLISECLFEKIVWTKIPTQNLIDSAQQV